MQRNMSHRKPVPEYVPSPPSSPTIFTQSHGSTQPEEGHSHTPGREEDNSVEKPVPPLPQNWREILAEANNSGNANDGDVPKAEKTRSEDQFSNKEVYGVPRSQSRLTGFIDGDQASLSSVAPSQLIYLRRQRKHGRGLPTTYRPPTPPLNSKQRPGDPTDVQIQDIYLLNPYSSYVRVGFPSPGASSVLRPTRTASFHTERTLASMNTTNISMGWPNEYPTSSERVLYDYPIQKPTCDKLTVTGGHPERSAEIGCLKFWWSTTRLRSWAKKFKLTSH